MKTCTVCGKTKAESEFYKSKLGRGGLRSNCKVCENDRTNSQYTRFERALIKAKSRGSCCNATPAEIEAAWTGKCHLCLSDESLGRRLCMDHDHKTGAFRGWLCSSCNMWLGRMGDDPILAAEKLEVYGRLNNYLD
jgi:hypothetical protein